MYIAIDNNTKGFLMFDNEIEAKDDVVKMVTMRVNIPKTIGTVYEVDEIPDGVEPFKYCYEENKGFYKNPNWREPTEAEKYGVSEDVYNSIIDEYTNELIEMGVI